MLCTGLRRILFTSLHVCVRYQRRTKSLQSGIVWVGLPWRAVRRRRPRRIEDTR